MIVPVHSTLVWTVAGQADVLRQLLQGTTVAQPGPALLCVSRDEAASLLGIPALSTRQAIELAASALRDRVCAAVVITGDDSEDYAHTAQASGWLRSEQGGADSGAALFASSAADALAKGFVAIEAIVLARMAWSDCQRRNSMQPRADFALDISNLPGLSLPQATSVGGFASLSDPDLGLYAVLDSAAWVERVLAAGVRTVQLRIKMAPALVASRTALPPEGALAPWGGPASLDAEAPERRDFVRKQVRQAIAAARQTGAQLFINDHWQLAIEEGAYGVHLGQEDLHIADLGAIRQAGLRLGVSTHAYWEVCRAWALQPSYIACGPIHPTQAKAMPWIPQGNDNLAYWCKLLPTPVVGIAGMDVARTGQAARAGAAGVAVISAITSAALPEIAIEQLQQALQRGRQGPVAVAPLLPKPTLAAAQNSTYT